MQYVRSISGSVSKTWNSINPATLSGAIDVVVVEREDGTLACSPFHVRFGKFQLLRPSDKKVEFTVNDVKRKFPMKVGEGGEAFFVFETSENIPRDLQTSPVISPATSPQSQPAGGTPSILLQEPEPLDLTRDGDMKLAPGEEFGSLLERPKSADGTVEILDEGLLSSLRRPNSGDWQSVTRAPSEVPGPDPDDFPSVATSYDRALSQPLEDVIAGHTQSPEESQPPSEAFARGVALSKQLWSSNIPTIVSSTGDLMLDMSSFKTSEEQALKAELIARKILSEDLEGNYDIGSLIGADEKGNIWIYSSSEAKEAADRKAGLRSLNPAALRSTDALSDPGYHSDDGQSETGDDIQNSTGHLRTDSDSALGISMPGSPDAVLDNEEKPDRPIRNYAKTLRLTNEQLKSLDLKPGANAMSFTVNKATCQAVIYYWRHNVPIVISDIDGTITKSDALGHVLNMIGRDWTHIGVAKLYTDIVANGYNILYLTSRSVGQADTTRSYLNGVLQDGYRLPKGPVIMSPDRTMAALRREVYLRKPEVFKMACLRDIMNLFTSETRAIDNTTPNSPVDTKSAIPTSIHQRTPFYAGIGNRLTDALSYRSVAIPPTRIFTINSNAEVSLHLLTLNSYRTSYLSIWELVDHYFPPVGLLIQDGGEEYTDFNYWRDRPRSLADFSDSSISDDEDVDEEDEEYDDDRPFILDDDTEQEDMDSSFMSHGTSVDEPMRESGVLDTVDEEEVNNEDNEEDDGAIDEEDDEDRHHNHHPLPDTIPEEAEPDEETHEEEGKSAAAAVAAPRVVIDDAGDLLVEESRQVQALDLAAEEETIDKPTAFLTRSATSPGPDDSRDREHNISGKEKDVQPQR